MNWWECVRIGYSGWYQVRGEPVKCSVAGRHFVYVRTEGNDQCFPYSTWGVLVLPVNRIGIPLTITL